MLPALKVTISSALIFSGLVPVTLLWPDSSVPTVTFQPELATVSFNWLTLTASILAVPAATLTILLLPLLRPSWVKETVSLPSFVIVTPSLVYSDLLLPVLSATVVPVAFTLVVSPAAFLTVAPLASTLVSSPDVFFNVLLVALDVLVLPAPSFWTMLSPLITVVLPPVASKVAEFILIRSLFKE